LNAKIEKLNLQIKAVSLSLSRLNTEITVNQKKVTETQKKLDLQKAGMMATIQSMYESERTNLMTVLLQNPRLTDFFGNLNNLLAIQDSLSEKIKQVNQVKEELLDTQEDLVAKKTEAVALKALQDKQKQNVVSTKNEKDNLLTQTKGKETEYQAILKEKRAQAAKIRSRIFELLGGGEMTFEQAYNLAKNASQLTGTPPALLLAVLDRESALGKNVGRCSYKTAMAPGPPKSKRDDVTPFLAITAELGINPDTIMVSCANRDGAYGGAMGPAQFIPTTWMLYKNRIASLTGNNPPSPWRNGDAFVATALYFQDALRACSAYTGTAQERCAAARYYAGGSWRSFLYTYGDRVVVKARQFEQDIQVLSS
jgi:membrane-bound lytic murein transglycosylase B